MIKSDFVGKWNITEMSEWDKKYINMEVQAFIKIEKSGDGNFQFGLVVGDVCGEFKKTSEGLIFDFTWDGTDECDEESGDGWMKIKDNGTAEGEIRVHRGDKSTFLAKRAK